MRRRDAPLASLPMQSVQRSEGGAEVTLLWFIVWFVADLIGDDEPLTFDPVNGWAGVLLLALALDLARQHAPSVGKPEGGA